jgi:hypothetical protein
MVPLATAFRGRGDELLWATAPGACRRLARDGFRTAPCGLDEEQARPTIRSILDEARELRAIQRPGLGFARIFGVFLPPMLNRNVCRAE